MYVGKRIKSILSLLLICGLLVVSVPCRAYAAGPLFLVPALSPAMKYAIGAGIVAGGLYAANQEALDYAISDYWNKASDYIKHQWQNAVVYGTGIGTIVLNYSLIKSINDYLNQEFSSGNNNRYEYSEVPLTEGEQYLIAYVNGLPITYSNVWQDSDGVWATVTIGGYDFTKKVSSFKEILETRPEDTYIGHNYSGLSYFPIFINYWIKGVTQIGTIREGYYALLIQDTDLINIFGDDFILTGGEIVAELSWIGDTAGFGNATAGRPDIKVPCPPLPAAEWPDQWVDGLLGELNRTGNPTLDDETFVEECEREWDWYWDDNVAYIYRVPHGDPPRDPDDEPIRIPIPPPPQPEIPFPQPDPIPQPAEPCPYCPPNPYPSPDGQPCPNPYCPNQPNQQPVPVPYSPNVPAEPCPYCPPNPYPLPDGQPCPNPYCPNQPNQQPVPTPPPDIQPFYDDPEINWEPLRRSLYELTEKFPFSLPWDLMRGVQSMEANQWDRKIRVVIGDEFWPNFEIDLTMFDRLARISRVIMLVIFDLGLIFATRKLMGGDV